MTGFKFLNSSCIFMFRACFTFVTTLILSTNTAANAGIENTSNPIIIEHNSPCYQMEVLLGLLGKYQVLISDVVYSDLEETVSDIILGSKSPNRVILIRQIKNKDGVIGCILSEISYKEKI